MPQANAITSLLKALDILDAIANSGGGIRLNELEQQLDLRKTTIFNLLKTLAMRGLVEKDSASRYRLGKTVGELYFKQCHTVYMEKAAAAMRRLYGKYPEATFTFTELTGHDVYCRLRMSPQYPGRLDYPVGAVMAPYTSCSSVCTMAFSPDAMAMMEHYPFEEFGLAYWKDEQKFRKAMAECLKNGFYLRKNEKTGRTAVAVAVKQNYSLGASLPEDSGRLEILIEDLKNEDIA